MFTTATFTRLDQNLDGSVRMVLEFTGDQNERPVEHSVLFEAWAMPTADFVRGIAIERLTMLNQTKNFISGALPFVGTVLDTTTPLPPKPPPPYGAFMATTIPFTPGPNAQDVVTLMGSATKTVTVSKLALSTTQTTAGLNAWALVKRSSANSGGTPVVVAAVPTSDQYPAATALVQAYTANATTHGPLVGGLWSGLIGTTEQVVGGDSSGVLATLSGPSDVLAWNFGAAAIPPGLLVRATVWWTES